MGAYITRLQERYNDLLWVVSAYLHNTLWYLLREEAQGRKLLDFVGHKLAQLRILAYYDILEFPNQK